MRTIDADQLRAALIAACRQVIDAHGELSALDAVAGDGDLGESLALGYTAVEKELTALANPLDVPGLFKLMGTTISKAAPSTLGTLLGLAWRDGSAALPPDAPLDSAGVAQLLDAMRASVARRGSVEPGQRTVLDGLVPSAAAAAGAVGGDDVVGSLRAATAGAADGAEQTKAMRPQVGRAGWIPERAQGNADAGASAWVVILGALADAVSSELND